MDLKKIAEIKARNLAALAAENEAKAIAKAEEDAREAKRQEYISSGRSNLDMVAMVNLVLNPRLGGRPLPRKTVEQLNEIRNRNLREAADKA